VEGKQAAGSFESSDSWSRMNTLLSTATASFADPALFAAFLVVNARDAAASGAAAERLYAGAMQAGAQP